MWHQVVARIVVLALGVGGVALSVSSMSGTRPAAFVGWLLLGLASIGAIVVASAYRPSSSTSEDTQEDT